MSSNAHVATERTGLLAGSGRGGGGSTQQEQRETLKEKSSMAGEEEGEVRGGEQVVSCRTWPQQQLSADAAPLPAARTMDDNQLTDILTPPQPASSPDNVDDANVDVNVNVNPSASVSFSASVGMGNSIPPAESKAESKSSKSLDEDIAPGFEDWYASAPTTGLTASSDALEPAPASIPAYGATHAHSVATAKSPQSEDHNKDTGYTPPTFSAPLAPPNTAVPIAASSLTKPPSSRVRYIRLSRGPFYNGFSTSICDLFRAGPLHKEDCCALACCGVLSFDKSRYLVSVATSAANMAEAEYAGLSPSLAQDDLHHIQGTHSLLWMTMRHVVIPLTLFLCSGLSAVLISEPRTNETITNVFFLLFLLYLLVNGILACVQRVRFRRDLSAKSIQFWRYQQAQQHDNDNDNDIIQPTMSGTGRAWSAVAPSPNIMRVSSTNSATAEVVDGWHQQELYDATCAHAFCCYSDDTASARAYNYHGTQVAGHRQGDMDACTYLWRFFAQLCCGNCNCWLQCLGCCALAQEAREIRGMLPEEAQMIDFITYEPYMSYYPKLEHLRSTKNNSLEDHFGQLSRLSAVLLKFLGLVLGCMFLLALLGSPISDLILVLATLFQAFLILYFVHWKWNRFDLSLDAVIKYFACGFLLTTTLAIFFELLEKFVFYVMYVVYYVLDQVRQGFVAHQDSGSNYTFLWMVYWFFTAFVQAALVEELCKYFGYWMLDHPDFNPPPTLIMTSDGYALKNDEDSSEEGSAHEKDGRLMDGSTEAGGASANRPAGGVHRTRSLNSVGAGITVAMVTVALGFASCENLVYEFLYTDGSVQVEFLVLLMRSMFPVHPLAAALQSIGVCRRDLEGDESYGLGRIIFPALMLHGTYDFSLMIIGFLSQPSVSRDNGMQDEQQDADQDGQAEQQSQSSPLASLISLIVSIAIMLIGVGYYVKESRAQKRRLAALDEANRCNGAAAPVGTVV